MTKPAKTQQVNRSIFEDLIKGTKLGRFLKIDDGSYIDGYGVKRNAPTFSESANGRLINNIQNTTKSVLEMTPIVGDVIQGSEAAYDFSKGDYGKALLGAGLLLAPNIISKPIKKGINAAKKYKYAAKKKINVNDYIDELEDANIFLDKNYNPFNLSEGEKFDNIFLEKLKNNNIESKYSKDWLMYNSSSASLDNTKRFMYETLRGTKYKSDFILGNKYPDLYYADYGYTRTPKEGLDVFGNYANAMTRRRSYLWGGLPEKAQWGGLYGLQTKDGIVAGFPLNSEKGLSVSHFAPKSLRSGVNLIKDLNNVRQPIVFSVTDDLSPQLEKLGFRKIIKNIPMPFGGEFTNKDILVGKFTTVEDLVDTFLEQSDDSFKSSKIFKEQYDNFRQLKNGNTKEDMFKELMDNFFNKSNINDVQLYKYNGKHYFQEFPRMKDIILK